MNSEKPNRANQANPEGLAIGIDGGGGWTRGCLIDGSGSCFYHEVDKSSNPHVNGIKAACATIENVVLELLNRYRQNHEGHPAARVDHLMCCLSGVASADEREAISSQLSHFSLASNTHVQHDARATLASAMLFAEGIVILAGTGSMVWGRDARGRQARSDGWGSLLGDEASAFAIGQQALRAALRWHDGRGAQTTLGKEACAHFNIQTLPELIPLLAQPKIPRLKVAQFAAHVVQAAEEMDAVAIEIVSKASQSLVQSALSVRAKLIKTPDSVTYVLGGRLAQTDSIYRQELLEGILRVFPQDQIICPQDPAELGAARLALLEAGHSEEEIQSLAPCQRPELLEIPHDKKIAGKACRQVFEECSALSTEQIHPDSVDMEQWKTLDILRLMHCEDTKVAHAVEKELPRIAQAVEWITDSLRAGGHLIYIGAGSSGRIGVLDAAECPPTFGTSPQTVQAVIAGGYGALLHSREGAEDQTLQAEKDLKTRHFSADDILIALAASGRTPYVLGGLEYAHRLGARTILITCNQRQAIATQHIDLLIAPQVGPEILMGSTRLKAATAQKMICNMLSTTSMIGLGKVYRGTMVDMQLSSAKLIERAHRIVMLHTEVDYDQAHRLLEDADMNIKVALVMALRGCSAQRAREALTAADGFVSAAMKKL